MKRKIIPDPVLMMITILVIICFQVYWLKDNYDRERKTLQIKTGIAFQETIHQLQALKLKLPYPFINDSIHKEKTRIFYDEDMAEAGVPAGSLPRHQVITMVNNMRDKLNDSLKNKGSFKSTMVLTLDGDPHMIKKDSIQSRFQKFTDSSDHIFNVLYRVDSLQDSIKVNEIVNTYSATLKKQNLNVPFRITRFAGATHEEQDMDKVVVGFAHPVTYQFLL